MNIYLLHHILPLLFRFTLKWNFHRNFLKDTFFFQREENNRSFQISKERRRVLPESRAAPRTLPWADGRSNKYYGSWRCNTGTVAVAFQSRTVSRTRLGRHNCPCPSCIVQSPRKTNTTVYVALGPVRVSAIRANGLGWLCHLLVSLGALYSVTSG